MIYLKRFWSCQVVLSCVRYTVTLRPALHERFRSFSKLNDELQLRGDVGSGLLLKFPPISPSPGV